MIPREVKQNMAKQWLSGMSNYPFVPPMWGRDFGFFLAVSLMATQLNDPMRFARMAGMSS